MSSRSKSSSRSRSRTRPSNTSSMEPLMGSRISRRDPPPANPNSQSWPPLSPRSSTLQRTTTGYPGNVFSPSTGGSAPGGTPAADDHYRDTLRRDGIPRASHYTQGYEDYKGAELHGAFAKKQYSAHLNSSSAPARDQRSGAPPGAYVGEPLGTPSYQYEASRYADNATQAYTK